MDEPAKYGLERRGPPLHPRSRRSHPSRERRAGLGGGGGQGSGRPALQNRNPRQGWSQPLIGHAAEAGWRRRRRRLLPGAGSSSSRGSGSDARQERLQARAERMEPGQAPQAGASAYLSPSAAWLVSFWTFPAPIGLLFCLPRPPASSSSSALPSSSSSSLGCPPPPLLPLETLSAGGSRRGRAAAAAAATAAAAGSII